MDASPLPQGASQWLEAVMRKPHTRNLFAFSCLLAAFTLVQGVYGFWMDSLGEPRRSGRR